MAEYDKLSDMELASLLSSRICHDLISPVGAIANGLEVLAEYKDEEMRKIAFNLIENSAHQASVKLQFARLAFGAAGNSGMEISMGDAGDLAKGLIGEGKVTLSWDAPRDNRPKTEVKLALNMVLIAMSCIPRGGTVTIDADASSITATAKGRKATVPEKTKALLAGETKTAEITAHLIQPYYMLRLLDEARYRLDMETKQEEETVIIKAYSTNIPG